MTESLPFDRSQLLDELRGDSAVSSEVLERVRERVTTTLTAAHLAAIGQSKLKTAHVVPQPALPTRMLRASWSGLAAALAVGTALGAGGHAVVSTLAGPTHVEATIRNTEARKPAPQPAAMPLVAASAVSPEAQPSPLPAEETPTDTRSTAPKLSATQPGLSAELHRLEQARSALAQGQPGQALSLLASHAQRFPRSMVAQERDALSVKALVAAGRHREARAAGEQFMANYPSSLLLDAVKASLATIP